MEIPAKEQSQLNIYHLHSSKEYLNFSHKKSLVHIAKYYKELS